MDMKHLLSTIDQLQSKEILNEGKEASYSPSYRVGKTGDFSDKPHMKRGTPVAGKVGKYGKTSDELGDPDQDPDEDTPASAEKRGRGRPKKAGSAADTKDRYSGAKDLQNIMIGKVPKSLPGKKGQVHKSPQDKEVTESKSLKDWFERLDEALNEAALSPTQTLVPGMQTGSQKAQPTVIDVKNNPALKAALDKAAKDKQLSVVGITQPSSGMTSGTSTTGMSGSSTGTKIAEKIEPPIKLNPAEKGKYDGKTVAELKKSLASVKARMASMKEQGKKVPHDLRGHFSELTFAIRAKQEGSGKWGAIKEADPPPDGGTMSPLTLEGKKQHYDKGYYDSLAASKKDGAKSIVKSRKDAVAEEKTSARDNRAEKAGRRVTKDLEYDMYHHGKDDNKAERAGRKVTKDIEYDEKHHHFYEEKTVTRDNRAEKAGKKVTKDIEYDEKVKDKIHGKKRGPEDQKAERVGRKVTKDIEYDEKKLPTMAHVKKMCKDGLTVAQILKMHPKCDATALKKMISDCKKKMVKEGRDQHLHAAYHEGKSHGLSKMPYSCRHDDMEEARMYHEGYKCGLDECYGQQPIVGYVGEETDSDIVDTMASYGARGMEEGVLGTLGGGALGTMLGGPLGGVIGAGLGQSYTQGGSDLIEDDLDEVSRGEYMKQKARTTPGDTFKAFGQTFRDSDVLDELAFESLDKQLNALLNEGVSVSISQGQQGAPNSVNVNATDAEADKLLAFVKQAGLGIFGGDAGSSESSMPADKVMDNSRDDDAEIAVVDDHDDMLSLIRKMTGQGPAKSSDDYEDEESHSDHDRTCSTCHSDPCECDEQIDEVQSEDQMTYEVAEDDAAAQNAANIEAGAEAEAAADKSEEAETSADEHSEAEEDMAIGASHGGNGKTYGGEEEELEESFANAADDDFEADINFMTKVISGGLNKQKSTGQTTIPVISGQTDRMGYSTTNESINDWKKLAGLK
jgi:hypothetical protein